MAVKIQILGLKETLKNLDDVGKKKISKVNDAIHDAGFFIEAEVKESIAGHRSEMKSFDTGNMARMVHTDNSMLLQSFVIGQAEYTQYLEYEGASNHWKGRYHFRNTRLRNQAKVKEFVQKAME